MKCERIVEALGENFNIWKNYGNFSDFYFVEVLVSFVSLKENRIFTLR